MSTGCRAELRVQRVDVLDRQPVPLPADLGGSLSKIATMSKPALPEAAILHQRAADLPCPDHRHPVAPLEAQNLAAAGSASSGTG